MFEDDQQPPQVVYESRPSSFSSKMLETVQRAELNRTATLKGNWLVLQFIALPLLISEFVSAGEYPTYAPGEMKFLPLFAAFQFLLFGVVSFFPLFISVVIDGVLYGVLLASSVWINMFALFEAISFGGSAKYPGHQPKAFTSVCVFASLYYIASVRVYRLHFKTDGLRFQLAFVIILAASKNHVMAANEAEKASQTPFVSEPIVDTNAEDSA
jgi:hypothetical protein